MVGKVGKKSRSVEKGGATREGQLGRRYIHADKHKQLSTCISAVPGHVLALAVLVVISAGVVQSGRIGGLVRGV